jgi:DNA-directed RNA polymerase subunit H (RpoH/RPB5)
MVQKNNNSRSSVTPTQSTILEQGDIFFFYRPKVRSKEVKSIEDVRRFFVVLAPESNGNKKNLYRLLLIGKKSLPEIRESEARSSERYWARVGGIFDDPTQLTNELLSKEFREGDMARPVGEGKYAIVDHNNHTELAFVLELPKELGEAQKELGIEKEASYIITVINPKIPRREEYLPTTEEAPKYPESVLNDFSNDENFVPLSRNLKFIDYQNAQIILIGAREGKDTLPQELGITVENERENEHSADIFTRLRIRKDQLPIKPLVEGTLE